MDCRREERRLHTSSVSGAALPGLVLKGFALGMVLAGLASGTQAFADPKEQPVPLTVPKAKCGPNDHPETALQGQVPAPLRASGFHGFSCNLELIGQVRGDGANWQTDEYRDQHGNEGKGKGDGKARGRACGYHGTAFTTAGRTHTGVPAIDITNPSAPAPASYLTTTPMLDPWESLKVNERRALLSADNGHNGGGDATGGPQIDVYDLSTDCRYPQLLASAAVGTGTDGGVVSPVTPRGHEGAWAPDGLTYYIGDTTNHLYHAIDMSDPTRPKEIAYFDINAAINNPQTGLPGVLDGHGLSVSDDGNRAYVAALCVPGAYNPATPACNGFAILDTSQVQARKPNAQIKLISSFLYKDGSITQHTIPVKIKGHPYVIQVDEGGSGGITFAGWSSACAAGVPLFPMARIVDVSDEKNPALVSRIMHEVNNPANCAQVLPDLVGLSTFTYGTHYCSVDNRNNATTLACGMFNSGIRVFDIRDPERPKEIAYYNPAGTTTASPGSNHVRTGGWIAGGPDWCSAQVHLNAGNGTIWTTCQDNGMLMLRFTNSAWPFPESSTPPGKQN
jgi:hypothetical protein